MPKTHVKKLSRHFHRNSKEMAYSRVKSSTPLNSTDTGYQCSDSQLNSSEETLVFCESIINLPEGSIKLSNEKIENSETPEIHIVSRYFAQNRSSKEERNVRSRKNTRRRIRKKNEDDNNSNKLPQEKRKLPQRKCKKDKTPPAEGELENGNKRTEVCDETIEIENNNCCLKCPGFQGPCTKKTTGGELLYSDLQEEDGQVEETGTDSKEDEDYISCTPPGALTPLWSPPRSPHCLIEEELYHNPWGLLVATIFLTKTKISSARKYISQFLKDFPDPQTVVEKQPADLEKYFVNIGLRKRAEHIWRMSHEFLNKPWKNARELTGIGKYGEDAFRIFCLGDLDCFPSDRYLKIYQAWFREFHGDGSCSSQDVTKSDGDIFEIDNAEFSARDVKIMDKVLSRYFAKNKDNESNNEET